MNDKEIELKFRIAKQQKQAILQHIESITTFKGSEHMVDTYYIPNFKDFEIDGKTIECVRIREVNGTAVICYKHIHYEANPIYCDEFETKLDNKEQMEKILFALGFSVQMVIDKTRVSYFNDKFEFDFDTVENLGELMEIELKDNKGSINDIYELVRPFGLDKTNVTYEGIQLMLKKALQNK
jgi:predicted adenylyl cyclase CyaB